jgi:hypothetical protein
VRLVLGERGKVFAKKGEEIDEARGREVFRAMIVGAELAEDVLRLDALFPRMLAGEIPQSEWEAAFATLPVLARRGERITEDLADRMTAPSSTSSSSAASGATSRCCAGRDRLHGRGARAAGLDRRGAHPVPRARRRQPRADGLEHAAPGGAAPLPARAAGGHGAGAEGRRRLGRGGGRAPRGVVTRVTADEIIVDAGRRRRRGGRETSRWRGWRSTTATG